MVMGMGGTWEGNSAGSGLGLRAHILSEELSRYQAVRGPSLLSVCRSPQSCWSDGPLVTETWSSSSRVEGGPEARRWDQSCQIQDQEASSWALSRLLLHQQQAAPTSLVVGLVHTDQQADSLPAYGLAQGLS